MILSVVRNHKDYSPVDEDLWRSLLLVADSRLNSLTQQQSDPISVSIENAWAYLILRFRFKKYVAMQKSTTSRRLCLTK
jgi:hypothetical protein